MGLFRGSSGVVIPKTTKEVDVAVSKATRNYLPDDCPKEKHVLALKGALETGVQRSYVAVSLLHRLHGAHDWVTAVKTSVVIHRLIKETQPPTLFMDELCKANGAVDGAGLMANAGVSGAVAASGRRRVYPLQMDGFLDTKATEGKYDFSEWVRAYCKFIDESLDTYYHTAWYTDLEKSGNGSKMRSMSIEDLLETLPRVQRVQRRLIDCRPTGAACQNDNTLLALSLVVRESFKLYKAISEGIINLADKFFQMDYHQAIKALEIYNEACHGCEDLQKYLSELGQLDAVKRVIEFPKMEVPPRDFLDVMKDHIKDLKGNGAAGSGTTRKGPLRQRRVGLGGDSEGQASGLSLSSTRDGSGIVVRTTSVGDQAAKDEAKDEAKNKTAAKEGPSLLDFGDSVEVGIGAGVGVEQETAIAPPPEEDVDPFKGMSDVDLLLGLDVPAVVEPTATTTQQTNNNPFA